MEPIYLSYLPLQARHRTAQFDLSDCHALHRRLLMAFPDLAEITAARDHFGLLYRVEPAQAGVGVLVQSSGAPDWGRLPVGYLRAPATVKRVDDIYASITEGQRLIFRLRANPTKRLSDRSHTSPEAWRGKRVDLRTEEDQLAWLRRKGEGGGFALLAVRAAPAMPDTLSAPGTHARDQPPVTLAPDVRTMRIGDRVTGTRAGQRLTFASVVFEGRLRVTDPTAFRQTLANGIGSGKAYGFGLVSIAPDRAIG